MEHGDSSSRHGLGNAAPRRSRAWTITLNNYTDDEYALLRAELERRCSYAIVGKERGESGTPHLQGYFRLRQQTELKTLKNYCLPFRRAHFEVARGSAQENFVYCSKDGDFWQFGELPRSGSDRNAQRWTEALEAAEAGNMDSIPADLRVRYYQTFNEIASSSKWKRAASRIAPVNLDLRPWQSYILDQLVLQPHDRKILVVNDPTGGAGKSTFAKWLRQRFGGECVVFHPGRSQDLSYILDEPPRILVCDCPRNAIDHIPWSFIESVKDGYVVSTKYQGMIKEFPHPHVVLFMNGPIPDGKLSQDRIEYVDLNMNGPVVIDLTQ